MRLRAERQERPRTIRLQGELDISTAGELDELLAPLMAEVGDVVLDLSGRQLGPYVLLGAAGALGERARLVVRAPTRAVRRVLDLTGADHLGGLTIESEANGA